jgi:putative spermidine/putrescine transport system ATP-binding protein
MVTLGTGPFQGTVRGTSFAGDAREYLLDSSFGPIKAEVEASQPAHALGDALAFDLPAEKAAPLSRFV